MSSPGMTNHTGAADPYDRQQGFSGRVLLTAVVILFALTVVFVAIRVLLYMCCAFGGRGSRGGLAAGIRRSMNSFGSSRRGLDASALSAMPVTAYRKSAGDADCAVCLSELAEGDKVRELPNCGHVFHVECVDAWLRSRTTCPLCRAGAETEVEPKGNGKEEAAQPALSGPGGGSFIVTVHEFPDTQRDARGSTSGAAQLVSSYS